MSKTGYPVAFERFCKGEKIELDHDEFEHNPAEVRGAWAAWQYLTSPNEKLNVPERLPGEKFSEWAKRTYDAQPVEQTRALTEDAGDAARYRLLRRGQHWSVINGIGDTLRGEYLDDAIDAALTAARPASGAK